MANRVDYSQLEQAKVNVGKKFDEMLQNLSKAKSDIDTMNENSWTGVSASEFNRVFLEISKKINEEREAFNQKIDTTLAIWSKEFEVAEAQATNSAQNM